LNPEGHAGQAQIEQASAARLAPVIGPLGRGEGDQLELAPVQAEPLIEARRRRFERAGVGQEDLSRAALDQTGRDRRGGHVIQALGREHDGEPISPIPLHPETPFLRSFGRCSVAHAILGLTDIAEPTM
jgi:hypothetical protein